MSSSSNAPSDAGTVRNARQKERAPHPALRRDPEILQDLVDHAGMLVLEVDLQGRIVWFNSVFERLTGKALDHVRGLDWIDEFIPAEHRDEAHRLCRGQAGKERGDTHTKPFLSREKGLRHIEWFHSDLNDAAGHPQGILCIGRDVTDLQTTRNSLIEAEQLNRAVLETAVNAIVIINDRRLIESVNSATERLFGFTREEMIGQNVNMLMPEPYASRHDGYVENYKRTGRRKIIGIGREAVAKRKDGSLFPIDLSVGEVILPGGRRLFTGIIRDLTERKQLEEKILRISEEERHRIGQDIHDDLCQQIAAIGCLARVAQQRLSKSGAAVAAELREIVSLLTAANQRAREMARGLMPVVLDAGGLRAALADIARGTRDIFNIACHFECDPPVEVRDSALATQLYRIAQEAVANAVKHSQATRLELRLAESDDRLILTIRDNGRGIPDHSPGSGTGMGLLTMSRRARMMGGDISVENHPLGGTLVTCSIPTPPAHP